MEFIITKALAQGLPRNIYCPPEIVCPEDVIQRSGQVAGASTSFGLSGTGTINGLIGIIISWLLGIAFAVAVLFLIIGGLFYITSAGNEERSTKGKMTVINALIGIVIIVLSYVIVSFITGTLSNPLSGGTL